MSGAFGRTMLTRLLKMLSGLALFWRRRPQGRARQETTARAGHRTCDMCSTFMAYRSVSTTCRKCSDAGRVRHGPRPAKANIAPGGVEISLPLSCPVAPGAQTPRKTVRLGAGQAEALSRILLKPGSDPMPFDGNDGMLMVGWHACGDAVARITVWTGDKCDAALTLSAAQAGRLGEDIAGCIGIIWTDAPVCDHEFVDARNEAVASGEMRSRADICGRCAGSGKKPGRHMSPCSEMPCPMCDGAGWGGRAAGIPPERYLEWISGKWRPAAAEDNLWAFKQ